MLRDVGFCSAQLITSGVKKINGAVVNFLCRKMQNGGKWMEN